MNLVKKNTSQEENEMKDNQNKNLEAVKRNFESLAEMSRKGFAEMKAKQELTVYPEWTEVDSVKVLRVLDSEFVAVPTTGRKFDIINIEKGEFVCQVSKKDACKWLMSMVD